MMTFSIFYLTLMLLLTIAVIAAGFIAIFHVLLDNRQPVKTMAWIMVIIFLPVVGLLFYVFFGVNHRRARVISQRSMNQLTKRSMLEFVGQQNLRVADRHKQLVDLFVNQSFSLPFKDNRIDIITEGEAFFRQLIDDINRATHHIHICMYIFEDDSLGRQILNALRARVKAGVKVRVIYDDVGCWRVKNRFYEEMRESGIEVVSFLPVRFPLFTSKVNYRNHRKIVVIDGRVGYIGGMNIAERYVKGIHGMAWRDTMLRIVGSGVYALQRAFLVDWYFVDRTLISDRSYYPSLDDASLSNNCLMQVVTSAPTSLYPEIMQGYVRIILAARRYVYIETPYFMPYEPVLFALKTAATAGVDVRLLCPYKADARLVEWASRSYLREVEEAGVKVSLYQGGFLHAKMLVCDDALTSCGSTNVDFRSFENNFEANAFIYDEGTALRMKRIFLRDEEQSVAWADLPRRVHPKFGVRLWESITRLFSPLL